jgi:phage terminase Nu1 subunit (DNA packaging protein)
MRVVGQSGIADMFGVSRETIDNWQKDGMPVEVRGGPGVPSEYDSRACIAWMLERELRKVREESPNDRLARVKADAIEMDNAERRKLLIPADQLEPKLRAAMVLAREAWMDAVPLAARAARSAADDEGAEALLEAVFAAFLTRVSRWRDADVMDEDEPG